MKLLSYIITIEQTDEPGFHPFSVTLCGEKDFIQTGKSLSSILKRITEEIKVRFDQAENI